MHLYTPSAAPAISPTAVEVKIWEEYLLRNRTHIVNTLCAYSLDDGPWHETDDGRFIFRFTAFDWFNTIQLLLKRDNIHCDLVRHFNIGPREKEHNRKIGLVAADPDLSAVVTSGLESAGYQVKVFSSEKPVLESNITRMDLFIIDRHLPDIDGLGICRQLRTHPLTKDVPVILISPEATDSKQALLAGATDYIDKPFHIHYLLNVVARYTHRAR